MSQLIDMKIVITGTPGTGKSAIAKLISKELNLKLFSITEIAKKEKLVNAKQEVDIKKLSSVLRFLRKMDNYIVEGHLACEIKFPADFIFVLRTHPDALNRRLKKRKYNQKKIQENIMSEMLDYCNQRVSLVYKRPFLELDTSKRFVSQSVSEVKKAIKQKKKKLDVVDYSDALKYYLNLGRSK